MKATDQRPGLQADSGQIAPMPAIKTEIFVSEGEKLGTAEHFHRAESSK
jgi:hypothetical protein